jgi:hypothetical protein
MTDITTPTEKKPKEYTEDEYLRFLLKASATIDTIADHLLILKEMRKKAGPSQEAINYQSEVHGSMYGRKRAHEALDRTLKYQQETIDQLKKFNGVIKKIYTNDAEKITDIPNLADHLQEAKRIFETVLADERFARKNADFNAALLSDIEAIDKRLMPVLGNGVKMGQVLEAYNNGLDGRIKQAIKGTAPEEFRTVESVEGHKMGVERFRSLKNNEADRIIAQGAAAEKLRYKDNGLTWTWAQGEIDRAAGTSKEPQR